MYYRPTSSSNRTVLLAGVLVALCIAFWLAIFLDNPHAYEAWQEDTEDDGDDWVWETDPATGTLRQQRRSSSPTTRSLPATRTTPARTTTNNGSRSSTTTTSRSGK